MNNKGACRLTYDISNLQVPYIKLWKTIFTSFRERNFIEILSVVRGGAGRVGSFELSSVFVYLAGKMKEKISQSQSFIFFLLKSTTRIWIRFRNYRLDFAPKEWLSGYGIVYSLRTWKRLLLMNCQILDQHW